jgi:type II secretory pathway pseudopilin PulG
MIRKDRSAIRPYLRRRASRAFTLVELLVAVTAGLMVSAAAFILARNATRFFQHEARISSAQLSAVLGMERLLADIDRAAFLSTSNIHTTPKRCPKGVGLPSVPKGLESLAGIAIERAGSVHAGNPLTQSVENGLEPDRITIGGSFDNNDVFPVSAIDAGAGGGFTIWLEATSHEMKRAIAAGQSLANIFRPGRILRVAEPERSSEYYALIAGYDPLAMSVQVSASPLMPWKPGFGTCGVGGLGTLLTVNPVSRVRYEIRSLKDHERYKELVKPLSSEASGDDGRTELVRVELDGEGEEIPASLELIAEYAVDLKFGLTAFTRGAPVPAELSACSTSPGTDVYHCPIPMTPEAYAKLAGSVKDGALPELVRAVQIRLATRSRAPDRDADLGAGPDGRKYRFKITLPGTPAPKFARMRTLYAEKYLRSQESP